MSKPKHHTWFKFEWDKWRNDPQLRRCNKEAKGFWIDVIAVMEELDTYFLEGTIEDLCRDIVCTREEFDRSVIELKRTGTASISKNQGRVKIISRKILKDVNLTEYNRLKQQESRKRRRVKKVSNDSSKKEFKEEELREEEIPPTPLLENGKGDLDPVLIPASKPSTELGIWLDAVAVAVGAKDRRTLPKTNRWKDVCVAAMREDRGLERLLSAIKAERERVGDQTQFFTPEGVLQKMQMSGSKPTGEKLPSAADKQADLAAERTALKAPPAVPGAKS